MPGYDRSGPQGTGPGTGGGFGYCRIAIGKNINTGQRFGRMRAGRGGNVPQRIGRRRFGDLPQPGPFPNGIDDPQDTAASLAYQAERLKAELKNIEERLATIDNTPTTDTATK